MLSLLTLYWVVLQLCFGGCWCDVCDKGRLPRRMLLQDEEGLNITGNMPVEVGSSVQLCMPSFNTYFYPFANGNRQLVDPMNNVKTSSRECCASCLQNRQCNAWQWCPVEVGCSFANTTGKALSNTTFPYLGCQLLKLEGFSDYLFNLTDVKSKGEEIPFIAGAPLNVSATDVPGYDSFPGNELGNGFDFPCDLTELAVSTADNITDLIIQGSGLLEFNSSAEFGCVVKGSVDDVASVCTSIDSCQAFTYYVKGMDPSGSSPIDVPLTGSVGVLKTGDLENSFITSIELNPNSIVYVKSGVLPNSLSALSSAANTTIADEESGGGSSSTVTIAVVSSVVGVIVIIGLVVMVYYVRRYQQMTKSFPSPPQSGNASVQATANGRVQPSPFGKANGLSTLGQKHTSSDDTTGEDADDSIVGSDTPGSAALQNLSPGRMVHNGFLVSEVSLPSAPTSQMRDSAPTSVTNGSSARALMDAFSQMYKQRPTVDYGQFGSLLEDDESQAVAELEAAVEESRKSATSSMSNGRSTRIPSAIAKESTGLMDAGLVDDWSILPEEVEVCRRPDGTWWQLGTGGYGTVYKGLYHGIHPVAIKIIHHIEEDRHKDSFIREASLLKALRHKNVVQFLGASLDGPQGTALLVTELMELGDLWRALSAKDSTGERIFSWYNRGAQCMVDVANGLHYLHTKRVVHFDLKSANILLSKAGTAKLADIGMARVLNKSYLSVISGLGTFAWSAPEVLAGKRCTEKADIYSWGVVLWEICTGEAPARGDMRPLQAPEDCPQTIVDLYEQCVAELPDDRPSATEVLEILNSLQST